MTLGPETAVGPEAADRPPRSIRKNGLRVDLLRSAVAANYTVPANLTRGPNRPFDTIIDVASRSAEAAVRRLRSISGLHCEAMRTLRPQANRRQPGRL